MNSVNQQFCFQTPDLIYRVSFSMYLCIIFFRIHTLNEEAGQSYFIFIISNTFSILWIYCVFDWTTVILWSGIENHNIYYILVYYIYIVTLIFFFNTKSNCVKTFDSGEHHYLFQFQLCDNNYWYISGAFKRKCLWKHFLNPKS